MPGISKEFQPNYSFLHNFFTRSKYTYHSMRRPKFSLLSLLLFTLLIASTGSLILNAPVWKSIPLNTKFVYRSAFSPTGTFLVIEHQVQERENYLTIYDARRGFKLRETSEYLSAIRPVFSNDEKVLLVGKNDNALLWEWSANKVVHTFESKTFVMKLEAYYHAYKTTPHKEWLIPESDLNHKVELQSPVWDISFSQSQQRALTLSSSGTAIVYELPSGEVLTRIHERCEANTQSQLSPDGKTAAFVHNNVIRIYSVDASQPMRELKGHTERIRKITFLSNGNLVSTSEDRTIREWNTQTGVELSRTPEELPKVKEHMGTPFDGLNLQRQDQYPAEAQFPTAIIDENDKEQYHLRIQTRPDHWWTFLYLPEFWTTLLLAALFLWNLFRKPK